MTQPKFSAGEAAEAVIGPSVKRVGAELAWVCPCHNDHDPSHSEFKNYYFAMYQIKFAGVPAVPWDEVDGAQLNLLLKKNPSFDIPVLKQLFMNWWESDNTNRALKPAKWLPRLPEYASGPQDVYGRPMKELRLL